MRYDVGRCGCFMNGLVDVAQREKMDFHEILRGNGRLGSGSRRRRAELGELWIYVCTECGNGKMWLGVWMLDRCVAFRGFLSTFPGIW